MSKVIVAISAILMTAITASAGCGEVREIYYAELGYQDHYNSRGTRLETVAGILRQDRANYHKFYKRDPYDTGDSFFGSKRNRAIFEQMLRYSSVSRSARNAILYRNPKVKVVICYQNRLSITVY